MGKNFEKSFDEFCLVRFSRKSGKIDRTLEATGSAMLTIWAMQNCTKTKDIIIFHKGTGNIECYLEGTDNIPHMFKEELGNIESYCPGLLDAVNTPD